MDERCQHEGCECKVEGGDAYCSEQCREAAQKGAGTGGKCSCGHSGCTSKVM